MNKQIISILSVIVSIIIALVFYLYFARIDDKSIKPILIVPDNAAIIIESNQSSTNLNSLAEHEFAQRLLLNNHVKSFYNNLLYIDSLFKNEEDIANWFSNGKAVYAIHSFANKSVGFFMAVQTKDEVSPTTAFTFFQKNFPNRFKLSRRKFQNEEIYDFTDFKESIQFSIAFKKKLMLFSFDGSLVEMALLKINNLNETAIADDKLSFVQNSGNGFNLYINYKNLPLLLQITGLEEDVNKFGLYNNFAEKAIYNIQIDDDDILFKGAANSHETNFQYLDLLNSQAPIKNSIIPVLPEQINFALSFNFNGYTSWFKNVNEYLLSKKLFVNYTAYIDSIEAKFQMNFSEKMVSKFGNNVTLFSINKPGFWKDSTYITGIEINDEAGFDALLNQLSTAYRVKLDTNARLSSLDSIPSSIKRCYLGDAFKFYFTDLFEGLKANYYIKHKGFYFFANNTQILKELEQKWQQNLLLVKSPSFKQFEKKLAPQSNLELIINNENAVKFALSFLNKEWYGLLSQNIGTFKRAQWIGVQFAGSYDKVFASQMNIKFNNLKAEKTEEVWNIKLDSNLISEPFVVFSKTIGAQVIIVQDALKQLQMIDRDGNILWKLKLDDLILSKFTEIDLYKNGKSQWVFNTAHYIYVIDDLGKIIGGWPAWIPTGTNYPITVCDPNKDANYLFFASGIYFKASGFSSQGRLIASWNPKDIYPNLKSSFSLFQTGNTNGICALNDFGQIITYSLNGQKIRPLNLDSIYKWRDYSISNIDTGTILIHALDTAQFYTLVYHGGKKGKVKILAAPGYTSFSKISKPNETPLYLFQSANSILVKDENSKLYFQRNFKDSSFTDFKWTNTGDGYKICYFDKKQHLLNVEYPKGEAYKPFPIAISGKYAIGDIFNEGENWLICGDMHGQLFLYRIK